jgi:hypothetical protein
MNNNQTIKYTAYVLYTLSGICIVASFALSYNSLRSLFIDIDLFPWYMSYAFPLLFDAVEVVAAIAVFYSRLQDEEDTFAWRMVLVFTTLGIVANVTHVLYAYMADEITRGQALIGVFATSLFPLSVALVTHLLKRVIEKHIKLENKRLEVPNFVEMRNHIVRELREEFQQKINMELETFASFIKGELGVLRGQIQELQQNTTETFRELENDKINWQKQVQKELSTIKLQAQNKPTEVKSIETKSNGNLSKKEQLFALMDKEPGLTKSEYMKRVDLSYPTFEKYVKERNGTS